MGVYPTAVRILPRRALSTLGGGAPQWSVTTSPASRYGGLPASTAAAAAGVDTQTCAERYAARCPPSQDSARTWARGADRGRGRSAPRAACLTPRGCRVGHDAVVDVPAGVRVAALDFSHIRLGRAQAPELCVKPRERRHERGLLHATPAAHAGIHVRRIVVPRVVVHGRTGWNREAVRVQPLERSQKFGLLQRQRRRGPRG